MAVAHANMQRKHKLEDRVFYNRAAGVALHGFSDDRDRFQHPKPVIPSDNLFNVNNKNRLSMGNMAIFLVIVAAGAVPFSMMVLGAIHFHSCPSDTKLGLYMVIGGAFWLTILVIIAIWHCGQQCVDIKHLMYGLVPLAIFVMIWSGMGCYWIIISQCADRWIYSEAIGFTAALWGFLLLVFIACCCHND